MPGGGAAQAPAHDPGRRVPPPGRPAADARRRAHRGRHQRRPRDRHQGRPLPRRPLLPPERPPDPRAAAARPPRRHRAPGARSFAAEVSARLGRPAPDLDEETLARLRAYPWPGNVRELRSVIERALVLHPGRGLAALDLAPEPVGARRAGATASAAAGGRRPHPAREPQSPGAVADRRGPPRAARRPARGGAAARHRRAQPRLLLPQARPRSRHPVRVIRAVLLFPRARTRTRLRSDMAVPVASPFGGGAP